MISYVNMCVGEPTNTTNILEMINLDWMNLILNNEYFHLVAVIALLGAFAYAEFIRRKLNKLEKLLEGRCK